MAILTRESKSTDFEVHRNWLAITNTLPLREWYFEVSLLANTAISTRVLRQCSTLQNGHWTILHSSPTLSGLCHSWHASSIRRCSMSRISAMIAGRQSTSSEQQSLSRSLCSFYALSLYISSAPVGEKKQSHAAAISILLSPGLLIIDHIHFQYNGTMYGILILSIVLARHRQHGLLLSGIVFMALLCLKHIYLYLAPAWFVYLLRVYCLGPRSIFEIKWFNCIKLGVGILVVIAAAFGPFAIESLDQLPQIMNRLFPFSRGLCHAYWAPNVWAMYSFSDRVLIYRERYKSQCRHNH